ncbi:MAG: 50S ribosomal protein L10 [Candidatus Riflebacteria bacterium]|nr:50S ribosomal protein L10 [Candidatus Riflebacteria bacterium]
MVDHSKKNAYIAEFTEKLNKAKVVVLSSVEGVDVEQMNTLRKNIRGIGDECRVVKNTLVARALDGIHHETLAPFLTGSTLMTFGYSDQVAPVKVLFDFADKVKKFTFKSGMLGHKLLTVKELEQLSRLPSRPVLLSMMLSVMQGPMRNMVSVTQGPIRKLVYALSAIREKKEKASA